MDYAANERIPPKTPDAARYTDGCFGLNEIGATGHGIAVAAGVAEDFCDLFLDGARLAIQGYGAVGRHAARFLAEKGARLVAVADSRGFALYPEGFDYPGAKAADRNMVIVANCDILVPAARPDVIDKSNAGEIRAKLVVEGANIPATAEAEAVLHDRGILVVPDFIANAGSMICAAVEYRGGTEVQAMTTISDKIHHNTLEVLMQDREHGISPRDAANALAEARLREAMALQRKF